MILNSKEDMTKMSVASGRFSQSNPVVVPANDIHQAFIVNQDIYYNYRNKYLVRIPLGFYTDGISSPGRFNNALYGIQKHGPYALAGYLHDRLYFDPHAFSVQLGVEVRLTRKECDQIFRHACKHLGCPGWRANIATVCLYVAGWAPFYWHRVKAHYGWSQAWSPDRKQLLVYMAPDEPYRIKKMTVRRWRNIERDRFKNEETEIIQSDQSESHRD